MRGNSRTPLRTKQLSWVMCYSKTVSLLLLLLVQTVWSLCLAMLKGHFNSQLPKLEIVICCVVKWHCSHRLCPLLDSIGITHLPPQSWIWLPILLIYSICWVAGIPAFFEASALAHNQGSSLQVRWFEAAILGVGCSDCFLTFGNYFSGVATAGQLLDLKIWTLPPEDDWDKKEAGSDWPQHC